jgi:xylulokinase
MSCTLAAGLSLKWLRDTCCYEEMIEAEKLGVDPYVVMDRLAEKVLPGAGGLVYLPYLMGERSPHPDPDCRGVFFGLSASHQRANMIRAVMEGVAFSQLECVDVFKEMGVNVEDMIACGGGGRSSVWRQMLSDMYGCSVSTINTDEGPAFGAAILAGVGAGIYHSVENACDTLVIKKNIQHPNLAIRKQYEGYYKLYKKLYTDLQDSFKYLSKLPK